MTDYSHQFLGPYIRQHSGSAAIMANTPKGKMVKMGLLFAAFVSAIVVLVVVIGKYNKRANADKNKFIGVVYYTLFLGSLLTALYGIFIAPNSLVPVLREVNANHKWLVVWFALFVSVTVIGQVLWPSLSEEYEMKIENYSNQLKEQFIKNEKEKEELQKENYKMKQENMFL